MARHGIPPSIRGEAWLYLLEVSSKDKTEEMTKKEKLKKEYENVDRRNKEVRAAIRENWSSLNVEWGDIDKKKARIRVEHIICAFLNWDPSFRVDRTSAFDLACVALPLVITMWRQEEFEVFHAFLRLMIKLSGESLSFGNLGMNVAKCMMLFRGLQPRLYEVFEEEGLEANEWMLSWLKYALAKEFPMESLLNLWDAYFAVPLEDDLMNLHMYVCLAILHHGHETLKELEYSELKKALQNLPKLDVEPLLEFAYQMRENVRSRRDLL
eukprot:TRINITY_DN30326_c0_g1_i2.p1 TRINITY_DN30326_c0_g1~~TRINITY_DN30326_c0_g1_i2.p1  ORF type:complete len:312 (+),score=85.39 TRINITY_DN30326_c0_g1_i2:133-936(+)